MTRHTPHAIPDGPAPGTPGSRAADDPALLAPALPPDPTEFPVPTDEECLAHWDRCAMPGHIRAHSALVGAIAGALGERAEALGVVAPGWARAVRASGLLHDLAKFYCVQHGGNHAQLGAAWVLDCTGNPALAQGVMHHVWWPYPVDPARYFLPLAVQYADKRVRHDAVVSLGARYTDLFERYGKNETARERIEAAFRQGRAVEHTLSELLEVKLHACPFDSGRLVVRT
ncbi:phosphohydrolase [Desulfocurvus sp.]|jgi:hypothetical protein|uniref:phosphohydrolase n=1 Tax=Desulfocurvus sp. TaxID=2871698 RepID=UPI0025BF9F83|nr:phosphohydrolase [Desulfocurvus sp.]MCK9241238.1 phosphohydrolase [Desulfocurvus sp.]